MRRQLCTSPPVQSPSQPTSPPVILHQASFILPGPSSLTTKCATSEATFNKTDSCCKDETSMTKHDYVNNKVTKPTDNVC